MDLVGKAKIYYYEALTLMFASLSLLLSLGNEVLGFPTGFGMTIDLSAVPVFLSLFMISYKHSIKTLSLFSIALVFLSPTGFLGGLMKFTATLPLIIIPYIGEKFDRNALYIIVFISISLILGFGILSHTYLINAFFTSLLLFIVMMVSSYFVKAEKFSFSKKTIILMVIAVFVRGFVMTITNIYFAGPLFFKVSSEELIRFVESVGIPFIGKTSIYSVIFFWNAVQSIIDVGFAYLIHSRIVRLLFRNPII